MYLCSYFNLIVLDISKLSLKLWVILFEILALLLKKLR